MIERRAKPRVPLTEMVRYRLCDRGPNAFSGVGQTVNVSAGGMLLRVQHTFHIGDRISVTVPLPVPDNSIQLTVLGRVVRVELGAVAIQFVEQDQALGDLLYETKVSLKAADS
jgi:hypothetical protein